MYGGGGDNATEGEPVVPQVSLSKLPVVSFSDFDDNPGPQALLVSGDAKAESDQASDQAIVWEDPVRVKPEAETKEEEKPPKKPTRRTFARRGATVVPRTLKGVSFTQNHLGETVIEDAFVVRDRLIAEGLMTTRVPVCKVCPDSTVFTDKEGGCYICTNCGLVLGSFFDDRKPQFHEDDPEDTEGRVHAHPERISSHFVMEKTEEKKDEANGTTTTSTTVSIVSRVVLGTKRKKRAPDDEIVEIASRKEAFECDDDAETYGIAKQKVKRSPANVIASNIERTLRNVLEIICALKLSENQPLKDRCEFLVTQYLMLRTDPGRLLRSTKRVAVGCVVRACAERKLGIRRLDITRHSDITDPDMTDLSEFAFDLQRTLSLPKLDTGVVMIGFLTRYENMLASITRITPVERAQIRGLASWVRWVVEVLRFIPTAGHDGIPYVASDSGVMMVGRGKKVKQEPTSSDETEEEKPDDKKKKSKLHGKRPRLTGRYHWVRQIAETHIAGRLSDDIADQTAFWERKIRPNALNCIQLDEDGKRKPVNITSPSSEWPIRRCAPATIAASILWLVMQLRNAAPKNRKAFVPKAPKPLVLGAPLKERQVRKKRRPVTSSEAPKVAAAAATATTLYRVNQERIKALTGVNTMSVKCAKNSMHSTWSIIM